jgi:plasmid maintenance system antidote protein VapI
MLKSAKDIRREKFISEVERVGGVKQFVDVYGENPDYVRQLVSGTTPIGHRAARRLEKLLGQPENWMDVNSEPTPDKHAENDMRAVRATLECLIISLTANSPGAARDFAALLSERTGLEHFSAEKGLVADALDIVGEGQNAAEASVRRALQRALVRKTK